MDLAGSQGGGLNATYFGDVNFIGTKVSRTYQPVGFAWDNRSPDPDVGSDTFSARWTGQGEAPQAASHLHYHGRRWGVAVRERQTTDQDRRLESLTGYSGCEVVV